MKLTCLFLGFALLCVTGCTSVSVRPLAAGQPIKSVSIRENPKVKVADFLDVLTAGFARHGITSKVIGPDIEAKDEFLVTYVAYRNWDMAPYLVDATIEIQKNGALLANAVYHLKGKGGLSLAKWNSTKSKMDPVIDKLLENYK